MNDAITGSSKNQEDRPSDNKKQEQLNNECIICLDKSGKLIYNTRCKCKYYYHDECWKNLYIQNKCVLCNKYYDEIICIQNPSVVERIERNQVTVFRNNGICAMYCCSLLCFIVLIILLIAFLMGFP